MNVMKPFTQEQNDECVCFFVPFWQQTPTDCCAQLWLKESSLVCNWNNVYIQKKVSSFRDHAGNSYFQSFCFSRDTCNR